jgi:hypothetical protein
LPPSGLASIAVKSAAVTDEVETHALVYTGPPHFAGLVGQTLRGEGLAEVSWEPPEEQRGFADTVAQDVTVVYIVRGVDAVVRAAVAKVRERLRGRGTIDRQGRGGRVGAWASSHRDGLPVQNEDTTPWLQAEPRGRVGGAGCAS